MKNDCSIVKDLLPLYSEDMLSEETAQFVSEHLKGCENCEKEYESLKGGYTFEKTESAAPIKDIKKKIVRKRIASAVLSVFLVLTILITGYAVLSAREYFDYFDGLVESVDGIMMYTLDDGSKEIGGFYTTNNVEQRKPRVNILVFDEKVTGCSYYFTNDSDQPESEGGKVCHVEAWTSVWDKIIRALEEKLGRAHSTQFLVIKENGDYPIFYAPNNGNEETLIKGEGSFPGNSLPRLTLNYYLIISAGLTIVLAVLLLVLRKKEKARNVLFYVLFIPLSYLISQLLIMGLNATTYSIMRDFGLIVSAAIFIYCVLVMIYRIILVKKEIKEINKLN